MKDIVEIRKSGKFYNTFGDDAIVIHYLLGYKVVKEKGGTGFPETAYNKVINALEENEISYKVYEKDKIIAECNYKKINGYKKALNNGISNLNIEERIDKVFNKIKELKMPELDKLLKVIEDAIS